MAFFMPENEQLPRPHVQNLTLSLGQGLSFFYGGCRNEGIT